MDTNTMESVFTFSRQLTDTSSFSGWESLDVGPVEEEQIGTEKKTAKLSNVGDAGCCQRYPEQRALVQVRSRSSLMCSVVVYFLKRIKDQSYSHHNTH